MARKRKRTKHVPIKILEKRARKLLALVARRRGKRDTSKHVPFHVLESRARRMVRLVERRGGKI